jgi:hypothetical protein
MSASNSQSTPRTITSGSLTTCGVVKEGWAVRLDFLDTKGQPYSVEFPVEQVHSIVMTLPRVLSEAVQRRTQDQTSRCVFSLGRWTIESTQNNCLVVTLSTVDGFEVSFGIPFDTCVALGSALRHEGRCAMEHPTTDRLLRPLIN